MLRASMWSLRTFIEVNSDAKAKLNEMKIRIKDNSLRYRITRPEVDALWENGLVEARTAFTGRTLVYAIQATTEETLSAIFEDDRIVLHMPANMIRELYATDRVGFEDTGGPVRLLVEKDFVCIDNTMEDQSDNYPNPSLSC